MSWEELLKGLVGFSQQTTESEKQIREQKDRELREKEEREWRLLKQYAPRVERVVKEFAHNIGKRTTKGTMEKKFGFGQLPYWFLVGSKEGSDDYYHKDLMIYPDVEIFPSYGGIGIGMPSLLGKGQGLEQDLKWLKSLDDKPKGYYHPEGHYHLVRESTERSYYTAYYYFMPFEAFSEEKLAQKLSELYKEAMENYLKSLRKEGNN